MDQTRFAWSRDIEDSWREELKKLKLLEFCFEVRDAVRKRQGSEIQGASIQYGPDESDVDTPLNEDILSSLCLQRGSRYYFAGGMQPQQCLKLVQDGYIFSAMQCARSSRSWGRYGSKEAGRAESPPRAVRRALGLVNAFFIGAAFVNVIGMFPYGRVSCYLMSLTFSFRMLT